ncbi:AarF/ABC1/UbiB kinase family protein [Loktanella sp. SALINAS62]|uniref:ABC1 kinase family protein n=1 Tax=Loktanella sp. SALINAS62 TaxID=2706124 RepID=UPI001B8CADA1|nr:AarF/ABC1/UbiB kinase family protein [Loktanella sp. SALINAS62]MBS1303880.1 AarF/ABC1/UbiB kinase family protein [Loktanella sp. SALINAS62]
MTDKPTFSRPLSVPSRRLSRVGRLGAMTAGVAGNMAVNGLTQLGRGQRPAMRDLLLTPGNVTRIAEQLARMRGAAMKLGQLISMDTGDALPPELAQIMARLRDDAHHMPPAQLKKALSAQWPADWLRQFAFFDVRPIAAASIGQVHRAQLRDGRDLAIKVQYPGIADSIDSDVANVGVLMRMSGLLPKGFDLKPYLQEARAQLHLETDYTHEAKQLTRFGQLLSHDDRFVVPQHHPDWSTRHIIAMDYVAGAPIEDVATQSQDIRNGVAKDLIALTLKELFQFGVMQTDPNFANYRYQAETGRIVLLDFGAAQQISSQTADQYRQLLRAGLDRDTATIEATAQQIGFLGDNTATTHRTQIVDMIQTVFDALCAGQIFDFNDRSLARQMQAKGIALADSSFIPPPLPIEVLLLQRKFGGVFLLSARIGAQVDVVGLLDRYLDHTAP